jgi:hypothetical protein
MSEQDFGWAAIRSLMMFRIRNIANFIDLSPSLPVVFAPSFHNTGDDDHPCSARTGIADSVFPIRNFRLFISANSAVPQ